MVSVGDEVQMTMVVRREEIRAMQEAWRAYLDLALGLTETSRKRATKVAKKLVGKGNATAEQLQAMAEDLVTTSLANREALTRLVRYELERALGRVGLATADEVTSLTNRVRELEQQLAEAQAGGALAAPAAPPEPTPVRRVAKKTVAPRKAAASASVPPGTVLPVEPPAVAPAEVPAGTVAPPPAEAPARQAVAKRSVAKKAVAPAPVAKKAVAKKTTPVRKAVAKRTPAQEQP
jgi:polyhydroxyalkanoate synthesis regulator phasin